MLVGLGGTVMALLPAGRRGRAAAATPLGVGVPDQEPQP